MSCLGNFIYVEKFALVVLVLPRTPLCPLPFLHLNAELGLLNIEMPRTAAGDVRISRRSYVHSRFVLLLIDGSILTIHDVLYVRQRNCPSETSLTRRNVG